MPASCRHFSFAAATFQLAYAALFSQLPFSLAAADGIIAAATPGQRTLATFNFQPLLRQL